MLLTGKLLEGRVAVPVGGDLAGGRGLRRLENPWSQEQHARSCWAAAHGRIEQPGKTKPRAAASSVGRGKIQGFDGGLEGGGCLLVLVRVGVFLDLARQDAGGRGLVVRGSDGDALLD